MKSRITIEVDFDNGNKPVILAKLEPSDDVRDKLIHNFVEMLGGQSSWCKTMFIAPQTIRITPIGNHEFMEQSNLMRLMADHCSGETFNKPPTILHEPVKHPLGDLLRELKFGRPKADQDFLDKVINAFMTESVDSLITSKEVTHGKPTFWVIEFGDEPHMAANTYVNANLERVANIHDAIRFADIKSAEAFMECHMNEGIVVEHAWM